MRLAAKLPPPSTDLALLAEAVQLSIQITRYRTVRVLINLLSRVFSVADCALQVLVHIRIDFRIALRGKSAQLGDMVTQSGEFARWPSLDAMHAADLLEEGAANLK